MATLRSSKLANSARVSESRVADYSPIIVIVDSGLGTDNVSINAVPIPITDSGTGSESITIKVTVPVSDSGTGSESIIIIYYIYISDYTRTWKDRVADSKIARTRIASLSGPGDNETVLVEPKIVISETGTGTDSVLIGETPIVTDSGSGSEVVTITTIYVSITETGTGTDIVLTSKDVNVSDTASAREGSKFAFSRIAQTRITESVVGGIVLGSGIRITVQVPVVDSGTGSEVIAFVVAISISDSALGEDRIWPFDSALGTEVISITRIPYFQETEAKITSSFNVSFEESEN